MNYIILNLLTIIQYQYQQICWLINFICKYIPLKRKRLTTGCLVNKKETDYDN